MKETIDNLVFQRMLRPESIEDRIEYLDFMSDFYFKVMIALDGVVFKDPFRAEMTSSLQMMFTKAKAMLQLIDGISHRHGIVNLSSKADHTILFTLVRSAYEQLCVFELVYGIPDSDEKRKLMENIYAATAEVNRLKFFTKDSLERNKGKLKEAEQIIESCKSEIHESSLYQSLSAKEQTELDKVVFKKGEYQIVFPKEGGVRTHVGWDDVRDYCRLRTDALHGVYKFACNMAHPSYLALIQFYEAYKEGVIDELNSTAVMQMTAIMSVYIMDFLEEYTEAKHIYDGLDEESKFVVRMYSEVFRNGSKAS